MRVCVCIPAPAVLFVVQMREGTRVSSEALPTPLKRGHEGVINLRIVAARPSLSTGDAEHTLVARGTDSHSSMHVS